MDAAAVNAQVTENLLEKLADSRFLHVPLMNRVEARLSSRDQLESYLTVLVRKLEDTGYRSESLIDRIDRMTDKLRRLDQHT